MRIIVFDNAAHLPEQSQTLKLGERLGTERGLQDSIANMGIRFGFADHSPNSDQEHTAKGADVTTIILFVDSDYYFTNDVFTMGFEAV